MSVALSITLSLCRCLSLSLSLLVNLSLSPSLCHFLSFCMCVTFAVSVVYRKHSRTVAWPILFTSSVILFQFFPLHHYPSPSPSVSFQRVLVQDNNIEEIRIAVSNYQAICFFLFHKITLQAGGGLEGMKWLLADMVDKNGNKEYTDILSQMPLTARKPPLGGSASFINSSAPSSQRQSFSNLAPLSDR